MNKFFAEFHKFVIKLHNQFNREVLVFEDEFEVILSPSDKLCQPAHTDPSLVHVIELVWGFLPAQPHARSDDEGLLKRALGQLRSQGQLKIICFSLYFSPKNK